MVFYFTGTGNSLYIAKHIEETPISIPQIIHKENQTYSAESIGIVAPIYGHGANVHDGLFVSPDNTAGIRQYLVANGLIQ